MLRRFLCALLGHKAELVAGREIAHYRLWKCDRCGRIVNLMEDT